MESNDQLDINSSELPGMKSLECPAKICSEGIAKLEVNGNCDCSATNGKESKTKSYKYTETLLYVSEELATMSLGFSIDSGGSVTKLVYRSKEDYRNGVRIQQGKGDAERRGILRLLHFPKSDWSGLIDFLEEHCDIVESAKCKQYETESEGSQELSFWWQTGVDVQHYMKELDSRFKIRTRLVSEMDSLHRSMKDMCDYGLNPKPGSVVPFLRPRPLSERAMDRTLAQIKAWLVLMGETFKHMDHMERPTPKEGFDREAWIHKLSVSTGAELNKEFSLEKLQLPQMFVLIGSAMCSMILLENGKTKYIDMSSAAGKTVLGVGLATTGAKNFDELIEMAGRGRRYAVDLVMGELSNNDREKSDDLYSALAEGDSFPVFLLGKLSEQRYKGSYTVDDVALGVLHMFSRIFVKMSLMWAELHNMPSIVFVGSYVNHPLMREIFQESFYAESFIKPFYEGNVIKMAVLENSGHLCALGTWLINWEMEQEHRKTSKEVTSDPSA